MTKFTELNVNNAIDEIKLISSDIFEKILYEFQDDFEFVLFTCELDPKVNEKRLKFIRDEIKEKLSSLLYTKKDDYSWMVNIKQNGTIVDSVFPELEIQINNK